MRWQCTRLVLPLLLGGALSVHAGASVGDWTPVLNEKGIKGYSRSVAGSDILEFRSTVVIPARIELIGEILRDVEGLKRTSKSCQEVRIIEYQDRNNYTFYVAYSFPFPLTDRDVVIKVTTTYDFALGRALSDLRAVATPKLPPRKGYVRITDMRAQFVFEYLGRERTGIVYTSRTDPGGHIPDFLVNYSNKRALLSSAEDLRAATLKPEYQKAAATSQDHALVEGILKDPQAMGRIARNRLAEFIHDAGFVALLAGDPGVMAALLSGEGGVGETLLHGWGSRGSQRRAVAELLRRFLGGRGVAAAIVEAVAGDQRLLDRLLSGQGGLAELRTRVPLPEGK